MHLYMLPSKTGLLSEFWYSVFRSRIVICFILWIGVVLCLRHILHGTQWTKIRRPSSWMGIVLSHAAIFCHPLSKWRTMLIRRIEKKTSIDQGLKLLREAKELPSVSLSDNIPLVNSTSIPNPNRSERIVSNLLALFSVYEVEIKLQVRQKLKRGRQASVFFKPRETRMPEFLCLSCCRQDVVLFFITCP